jgi:hypothetical protein
MKARVALLGLFSVAVVACSNGSSGGGNTAATSPPPTLSPSASASETPSESATPTPSFSTTIKASHRCKVGGLSLSAGQGQGAAGSTILPLVFTNTGSKACTLYGYPGVSFLDSAKAQIGVDAGRGGGEAAVVTLAPGGRASALLQVPEPGNFSPGDCKQATTAFVRVYPPDETHFIDTPQAIDICTTSGGRAVVQPVVPGNGG